MSSLRSGSGTRSGDGSLPRRAGPLMESLMEPNAARKPHKDVDAFRAPLPSSNRSNNVSKIPQTAFMPPSAAPPALMRPALGTSTKSWGSVASNSSTRSGPNAPNPAADASRASRAGTSPDHARSGLPRKQFNLSRDTGALRTNSRGDSRRTSSSSSVPRSQSSQESSVGTLPSHGLTGSPSETKVATNAEVTNAYAATIYPELDRYRDVHIPPFSVGSTVGVPYQIATKDLPPPTPLFSGPSSLVSGVSGSPSTRFSESPGPGPYSRDTTPTSLSSHSPGIVSSMGIPPPRARQGSRARAGSFTKDVPNERGGISAEANPHTLAAIRESLTSSSSSSNGTVRDGDRKDMKKRKKRLSPLPPSPPPRKSSQKFNKSRDDEESPLQPPRRPAQPAMTAASPAKATTSTQSPAVPSPGTAPPNRPSRDGTPDLQSQFGLPRPVIHSNLSSTSLSERRTSTSLGPSALHRSVTPLSPPDSQHAPSRLHPGREPTPAPCPEGRRPSNPDTSRTTRTPSPSVSTFRTRFPLFGRRTKTAPEVPKAESQEKSARKGPAAGTGHEGYGRIGAHRRKSSTGSSITRGLAGLLSSQETLNSPRFQDPFLADRMQPVVIAGGEVVENRNTSSELSRTESNQSIAYARPSMDSRNDSQLSLSSREGRNTLWPSAFPGDVPRAPSLGSRRPSDSSESDALAMRPTLAFRRSIQRLKTPDQAQARLPRPIVTRATRGGTSPSTNSLDAGVMSDDSALDPQPSSSRGRKGSSSAAPKKLTKRARSPRKWNIFGRSQSQPVTAKKKAPPESPAPMPATVKVMQVKQEAKPVAFYTMMDMSEQEDGDAPEVPDVQEVLRVAQVFQPPRQFSPHDARERRPSASRSDALRQPPRIPLPLPQPNPEQPPHRGGGVRATTAAEPKSRPQDITVAEQHPGPRTGRPSRLPQVGRIPKVISARPEQTSPKSFSRPFHRLSVQAAPRPQRDLPDVDQIAKGPSPPKPATPELTLEESTMTGGTGDSASRYRLSREFSPDAARLTNEFLSFSPRKGSQCTSCTTSTSSGIPSFADATAVVPEANAPLVEDEIWDEYNDLLGEEQFKMTLSGGSTQGMPFRPGPGGKPAKRPDLPLESPTINDHHPVSEMEEVRGTGRTFVPSSVYSTDLTAQINEVLAAAQKALSPTPASELLLGFDRRRAASVDLTKRLRASQRSSTSSNASGRRPRRSDASEWSQGSEDNSPLSQVNLRVGSMTVSKWLTFGHVLFSPAREELVPLVGSLKRHSILVIDGLGNDDWSFYAAETYPAATFFNLSPRAPLPAEQPSSSAFPLSPPNHHQIQYTSHLDKFPFGPESFTAVVFRFPAAAPESHYRNIITEARRVLKPGGYLELSILDLDLNNMGNRARKGIRRLKERIHARAPDTNIGSTADVMLRLLGAKGFSDVKSCRVGVPVASVIPHSSGGSETSSSGSRKAAKNQRDNRSLAEMMSDESAVADESITNMVAKVGRWWYSRCYESAAAASGPNGHTMWADRELLVECEEWRTSLKLMVCHARVPDVKRVASI